MIRLESVTKLYDGVAAVSDLTMEVADGEVTVLIGPSGCGKTTTLRMVNRLIEPSSGRILIDGTDIATVLPEELRRSLGYAIQSVGLFPHLTVAANIGVVPRLLSWERSRIEARAHELLELVGLPSAEYAAKYPAQLSGGEAQRVGVARALAADPPVLLMDEPFGAVDPLTRERLQGEFSRIQQELRKTVILVTHDIDEAIRLADRIAIMRDGTLQQYAPPEEVLDRPANRFVHDFVGADRALKRLVRLPVSEAMAADPPQVTAAELSAGAFEPLAGGRFLYVVDEEARLQGWVDTEDLAEGAPVDEAVTLVDVDDAAVPVTASLKEALSRMLGLGYRSIAVVDEGCRLVGEVGLDTIESTMTDGAAHISRLVEDAGDEAPPAPLPPAPRPRAPGDE